MTRTFRNIILTLLSLSFALFLSCQKAVQLEMNGWKPRVKKSLNDFMKENRNQGRYVVFDFDNTVSIGDIQQQVELYQIFLMAFEMLPNEFTEMLNFHLGKYYPNEIADISEDYRILYEKYGPFHKTGVLATKLESMHGDDVWKDFSARLKAFFIDVRRDERSQIKSAITFLMQRLFTPEECYELAYRVCQQFGQLDTEEHLWKTPGTLKRRSSEKQAMVSFGISVTQEVKELWKALKENGIDIWVCSASHAEHVMAAIDYFELHNFCTGIIGTNMSYDEKGKLDLGFYQRGYEYIANPDGTWQKGIYRFDAQPRSEQKVSCIIQSIAPYYNGQKPIAAFGDSSSDFYFATEFESVELVLYFNTGVSSTQNGLGLLSMLALYEEEDLAYNYRKAKKAGDILFLLQGRNENGRRTLIPSKGNIACGRKDEILFGSFDCYHELKYIKKSGMSIKDAVNSLSKKTSKDDSPFHIAYGWIDNYAGYKTRK
ncbi:MAG: HAD family hydrolase [Alistipes sp.]|nr:HAD family hydrolase [Candidatus Alistipes equi]